MAEGKPIDRRHSHHGHLHLKPTAVIDHLKTKVRRKRLSKHDSSELSDNALNQNMNNNNNEYINEGQAESFQETSGTSMESQPMIITTRLSKRISFDEKDIKVNHENRM